MTNEEANEILGDVQAYLASRASLANESIAGHSFIDICNAIHALKAQPCEDCISRQKALDCFEQTNTRQGAKYAIETLPSVTPQRPKGKWIEIEIDAGEFIYKCTKCGMRVINPYKYCPICGAEMSGGEK